MAIRIIKEDKSDDVAYREYIKKMHSNETYKKVAEICSKYNYKLMDGYVYGKSNNKHVDMIIRETDSYHPEIYVRKNGDINIQTSGRGTLDLDELGKVIAGYQDAYNMSMEINKLDLFTLYSEED